MKQEVNQRKVNKRSQIYEIWLRMRKNKQAMFGLALFIIILLIAIFAGILVDYENDVIKQDIASRLQGPSAEHWLGTNQYGRDELARLIYGTRISLTIGVITVVAALVLGALIGAISGFYGGKLDNILMRIMDVFMSLPSTLLAIAVIAALGNSMVNLMIAIAISLVPRYARIIRSSILSIRDKEFIEAARAIGTRDGRNIVKNIIPNVVGPVIVQATLGVGETIISAAGLSFLGLGINPPMPEWGAMLSEGKEFIRQLPHLVVFPGISIILTVLSLNLMGDGLRDALDPRLK